jgi:DNA repair protein RadC
MTNNKTKGYIMNTLNNHSEKQTKSNSRSSRTREAHQPDNLNINQCNMFHVKQSEAANYSRLSDIELLSKLIGAKQAQAVYTGNLKSMFASKGQAPEQLQVAREILTRWLHEEMQEGDALNSPQAVRDFLTLQFAGQEYESFITIFLDAQHRVIKASELFRGTLTQTSVYPREIVKASLKHNAAAVIFAHNHPSGATEPSQSDRMLTDALKQALALVDVRVLDHFVVAGNRTLSFAERGMI